MRVVTCQKLEIKAGKGDIKILWSTKLKEICDYNRLLGHPVLL